MQTSKKPTPEKFQSVLKSKAGNVSEVAKAFKVTRKTVYNWINGNKKFMEIFEDQIESLIDFAESKLLKSINNGSDTATIFFLKTRGKSRGYVEKSEVDHTTKGESINKQVEKLTDDELMEKIEKLRNKMK
ncbi:hypothetical protein N180_02820 [Pedobacter antarcticus 4BY]|uniref:Homeodomain phBC6A51-type domain-containing protein n=2 Tax=Pedobacter antarcticus TaxID=34086 RepID=A0A081PKH5_9SPHI|nr:helix-turn-helix domain-containing protein [Pedobacter antarcticus]KEQ31198.1 hypothetical protein N180_02820 [Pedobacter antarcticus 4BY]SFE54680.1 hypothetical protein SAMN03003324_00852 [Pedobacter antarcticus]